MLSLRRFAITTLGLLSLALTTIAAAQAGQSFDGTVERYAHGFFEVRSLHDCKLHLITLPDDDKSLNNEAAFVATHRQNAHIVTRTINNEEVLAELTLTDVKTDADKACITDLGVQHVDGTISNWGQGNNGAGFDLRVAGSHTVEFSWVYHYGSPRVAAGVGLNCDGSGNFCNVRHPHVRVTYRTRVSGDGTELVPTAVDPI